VIFFPAGVLAESSILIRLFILGGSIFLFFITKKNLVYPTVLLAIILALLNNYFSL